MFKVEVIYKETPVLDLKVLHQTTGQKNKSQFF